MSFLSRFMKPKKLTALDVGSHAIKLAEFTVKKNKPVLEHFAFLPMPEKCLSIDGLINPNELKEAFAQFIKQNTTGPVQLCVSFSGRAVMTKKIEIPRVEKDMMDELVGMEAKQILPFDMEDINYNYELIENLPAKQEDRINVLLVAAKKHIVHNTEQLITSAGYACERMDTNGLAVATCVEKVCAESTQKNKNVLVLDIGKVNTHFLVLHGGQLIFEYYVAVGSTAYNNLLMKEMDIDFKEAEVLKLSVSEGKEAPEEVSDIMRANNIYLCDEVFVGNEYFKNQFVDMELSECYITGGGCQSPGLAGLLEEKFSMPVHILDPLSVVECSEAMEASRPAVKNFSAVLVGLCLRSMQ